MNLCVMLLSGIAWLVVSLGVVINGFSVEGLNADRVLGVLTSAPLFFAYTFWNEFKENL